MARTKEFDPSIALRSAMELFLERGYEATSVADLVQHLGVSRASLYATFGCKEELYRKALALYLETQPIDVAEILSQPGPVLPQVRLLLELFAQQITSPRIDRRCLVVNAAIERMAVDDQVRRRVESAWDVMETELAMALRRAKWQAELSPQADFDALARFVLVMIQGMRVFAEGSSSRQRLTDAVAQTMAALR
jgi:TetR/AcrR family transcriptional repressor of nem operon